MTAQGASYEEAGVGGQGDALASVVRHLGPTLSLPGVPLLTGSGHYAAVLQVSDDVAIAVSTDGVGSKTLIATALDRYDTIGSDCVAMNVNDVICVGARPIALVDYLGVHTLDAHRADEILRGLGAAAKEASIAIPGGEIAQLPEIIGSDGRGVGDSAAFDLVGTCIGVVDPGRVVTGGAVEPSDVVVGIRSSGIHSNGLTLAREVLLKSGAYSLDEHVEELARTLGDELLEPTEIYVRAVADLWDEGIETHGLAHITSDGFANLCRLDAEVTYTLDALPDPPAIFELIRAAGPVPDDEMYRVFNMGVGFIVVVPADQANAATARIEASGYRAAPVGRVTEGPREVRLEQAGLIGVLVAGESSFHRI